MKMLRLEENLHTQGHIKYSLLSHPYARIGSRKEDTEGNNAKQTPTCLDTHQLLTE